MIEAVCKTMPELPWDKRARFQSDYGLNEYDANVLVASRELADYFEQVVKLSKAPAKLTTNWVMGDLSAALNKEHLDITESPVSAEQLAQMVQRIDDNTISGKIAKTVFQAIWNQEGSADDIIEKQGLKQVTDSGAIEKVITDIIAANPGQLEQYRSGKDKLFGFFVGQVMKATGGKANPAQVNELLKKHLDQ